MRSLITFLIVALLSSQSFAGEECGTKTTAKQGGCSSAALTKVTMGPKDIVDTAVSAGSFNTLVAAVQAADLVSVLKSDGPFTVFAPTDEAFAEISAQTLASLLEPENKEMLARILTYHVVPGKVTSDKVVGLKFADTASGQRVDIKVEHGKVMIDNATVIKADIPCTNGVIHVIDKVIMPSNKDIVDTAVAAGSFNTLVKAVTAAELAELLKSDGPFTVFAPTDDAFAKLPAGTIAALLTEEKRDALTGILKYHVVPGRLYADQVVGKKSITTAEGSPLTIRVAGDKVYVNDARILMTDIETTNGVIHVIDSVILPKSDM